MSTNRAHEEAVSAALPGDPPWRRLIATWDGEVFRPVVAPGNVEPGQDVIMIVRPARDIYDIAGPFAEFFGTMPAEEVAEMDAIIEENFETISPDWDQDLSPRES